MNRKYAAGVLVVICAGAAAWFGMQTVERRTEEAVAESLASVSAKAGEIRYSFLQNTLTLKGVEYEFTDAGFERRGSIENVEVRGFNRRYVFTTSDAPYDPDDLPVVAESITATGIVDKMTFDKTSVVEQKAQQAHLTGWYQRLGTLLNLTREHRGEEAFFEELYRCRIDGMEVSAMSMKLVEPGMEAVDLSVERAALLEGLRAPASGEKVSPVSLGFFGLRIAGRDFSGGLDTLELRDILVPEPAIIAEIVRTGKKLDAVDEDDLLGSAGEALFMKLDGLIRKAYEDKMPVGRLFMAGGTFTLQDTPEEKGAKPSVLSMAMKSLDYRLSVTEEGASRYVTNLSGLTMKFPDTMEEADIIARYAPDGLVMNATGDSLVGDDALSGKARYELEGLGVLEGNLEISGDIRALQHAVMDGDPSGEMEKLMQTVRLKGLNAVYRDSGLMAMSVEIAARWGDSTVENELNELSVLLHKMAQEKERPVRELGAALLVLFAHPGEFVMSVAPERPMSFMEALMLASVNPDALPVSFSAKPGEKSLKDYLPKN